MQFIADFARRHRYGTSVREIAKGVGLAPTTVHYHVELLAQTLDVREARDYLLDIAFDQPQNLLSYPGAWLSRAAVLVFRLGLGLRLALGVLELLGECQMALYVSNVPAVEGL